MNFLTDPPVAEQGVPFPLTVFSGGRLSVDLAAHGGITEIRFFGKQKISDIALFRADPLSAFCQLFRPYADFGHHDQYFLEFENTAFYPFGYDSECVFHGIRFRHRFTVLNDALLFELETDAAGNGNALPRIQMNPLPSPHSPILTTETPGRPGWSPAPPAN